MRVYLLHLGWRDAVEFGQRAFEENLPTARVNNKAMQKKIKK